MKSINVMRSDDIICPNCKHTISNEGNLTVPDKYDRERVITDLKKNREYKSRIIAERNIKHLGKYWLLMAALEFHFGNTAESWHMHYKLKFLPKVEFMTKNGIEYFPDSIAFDNMDQLEFDAYYKRIDDYLIEQGYLIDELIETAKGV